eukprot:TRINITY_DN46031_c0_g1_i1.p1 TRINITY_DN46031_c0_g1~~TRINITY_DN46031_c0_g1_i1.p1  ORF type:complete len:297 (+),score=97.80 TRINITY_DN46031_c0_g1_i1:86-892(+)
MAGGRPTAAVRKDPAAAAAAAEAAERRRAERRAAAKALRAEKQAEAAAKEPAADPAAEAAEHTARLLAFWRGEAEGDCVCGCARCGVDEMLRWRGHYEALETRHHWVQWLFAKPGARGVAGAYAPPLTAEAAAAMAADGAVRRRVDAAVAMALDFWGLREGGGGAIERADGGAARWENVARNPHNLLRATRVLHSLRALGEHRSQWAALCGPLAEQLCSLAADGLLGAEAPAAATEFWAPAVRGTAPCGALWRDRLRAAAGGGAREER